MEKLVERFIKYVKVFTTSNEESGVTPSTPGQMVFAKQLRDELVELGKDIEKRTLSAALKLWLEHRVFVFAGRTFIL